MKVVQLKGVKAPAPEYCTYCHCPGDCGFPHNSKEYASLVLAEFDLQERKSKRAIVDKRAEVERKAR